MSDTKEQAMTTAELTGGPLALATGAPDPVAAHRIARLRDSVGRVTRRLGALGGAETARETSTWSERFHALPEDVAGQVVGHPFFGYLWLQLMQGCARGDQEFVRSWSLHLARFLLVPHLARCPDEQVTMRLPEPTREIRLPGSAFHLAVAHPVHLVRVSGDGDGVVRDGAVHLPRALLLGEASGPLGHTRRHDHMYIAGASIEVDSGDPWIHRHLSSMNSKPAVPGYPAPDLEPVEVTAEGLGHLDAAFRLIERCWPELAAEITSYVRLCVPYSSSFHSSFTEACLMEAVFLSEAMWPFSAHPYTAEHLLHEAAHLRLTLIEELDPLVEADRDVTFASPVRLDSRPLSGMLQTAFAFARIAAFHRRAHAVTGAEVHARRHAETAGLLDRALRAVEGERSVTFTTVGERLWSEMRAEAAA
ncbi:HEXXH motif-containing putative peptide modification protein [Nonomuraea angiospora]|uniref:aKG-HExxH-type peptide beta-hydroxylase n=1 Tax=Nonomuraea angiospora TaxID=46172 RepID=UPI003422EFF1